MPGRAPRRYKMDENGTVRSAFHRKLPEEFTERDMLAFAADTDLLLFQKVSESMRQAMTIRAGPLFPGPERRKQTWQNRKQRFRRRNSLPSGASWRQVQRRQRKKTPPSFPHGGDWHSMQPCKYVSSPKMKKGEKF